MQTMKLGAKLAFAFSIAFAALAAKAQDSERGYESYRQPPAGPDAAPRGPAALEHVGRVEHRHTIRSRLAREPVGEQQRRALLFDHAG